MLQGFSIFNGNKKQLFSENARRGDAARDRRAWDEAVDSYMKALEADPNAEAIWVQLGHAQKELGMFGKSEESYQHAIKLNPSNADTSVQLGHLFSVRGKTTNAVASYRRAVQLGSLDPIAISFIESNRESTDDESSGEIAGVSPVYFDYSDLVQYFRGNRFPTGIQRVQIELFKAAQENDFGVPIRACAFVESKNFWVDIDPISFRKVCDLSSLPGEADDSQWRGAVDQLFERLERRSAVRFPKASILVNVGTSWWIKDYGAYIRHAKSMFGLRYVPFVHDLIPLLTPEHCSKGLVDEFEAWANMVMLQADFITVNSVSTKNDVVAFASKKSLIDFEPKVVRLDAEFTREPSQKIDDAFLSLNGLNSGSYVLFVGTLESRKNHAGVFQAWKRLLKKYGANAMPTLVCVGKVGWLFDQASALLEADDELANKVQLLSGISDDELAALYRGCQFTVYASYYEGWGLPVTESLSFGKVCLAANNSSLPEAGGEFAEYFDNDSILDLCAGLERLMFDAAYRGRREGEIKKSFRGRPWGAVLGDLIDGVTTHFSSSQYAKSERETGVALIEPRVLYTLGTEGRERGALERAVGEGLRHDLTWHPIEAWGAWAKKKQARLAFKVNVDSTCVRQDVLLYLRVHCGPRASAATVKIGTHNLGAIELKPHECMFVRFTVQRSWLAQQIQASGYCVIVLDHKALTDLGETTKELDSRHIGLGLSAFGLCFPEDFEFRLDIMERQDMIVF